MVRFVHFQKVVRILNSISILVLDHNNQVAVKFWRIDEKSIFIAFYFDSELRSFK